MSKRTASNQSDHAANKARATKNQKDLEDFRKKNSKVLNKKNNEATTPQEEGVEVVQELTAAEKKLLNTMYDKKGNLTPIGKKVMNHGKRKGDNGFVESVELDENKNLIKDYEKYMSQGGKKDHNAIDYLMSMPKYKRMSKDQMAKMIGDAKRKGIFKEETNLEQIEEALSPQQISKMKKQYANTGDRISVEASMKMSAMVKKFGDEELVQLAKADIKWISTSAITALIIKGKAKMLDESFDIDAAVTALAEAGLWDNIHNKRKRIKKGSGEKMRKPGSKGAPSNQDFKDASEDADIDEIKIPDLAKVIRGNGLKTFKNKHYNVKKTKTDLAGLKARLAKMR
jgi:hypothetical protein